MTNKVPNLWNQLENLKKSYKWVDLSREVSPETPHWTGFPAMEVEPFYLLDRGDGFNVNKYTLVTQYGTHVDAPIHFVADRKYLDEYTPMDMVLPLCVIDKNDEVAKNSDYVVTVEDIQAWEKEYGNIPEGAFVAFRSDWSKRPDDSLDNYDSDGNKHFPGWSIEALQYMVEKRNIAAIGHETCDTDAPILSNVSGYQAETYILGENRYQVEFLVNLSELPAIGAIIFVTFPRIHKASGFTARCFAICP
ncbi:cyclase family protein [Clostridioides difficile]|nr:cyclase family protein [Clostridioides difficile]